MVKLFLHIGQPKTGSTAIQKALSRNRKTLLDQHRILYPNFHTANFDQEGYSYQAFFVKNFVVKNLEDEIMDMFKRCKEFCIENNIQKLIISGEGFLDIDWGPRFFKRVHDELFEDLSIVLYLRRQDNWAESAWKQWGMKNPKNNSIQDFIEHRCMNWYYPVARWLEFFDKSLFIIRPFEKESIGLNIIEDFLTIVGMEKDKISELHPNEDKNANPGFKPEVMEVLGMCNYLTNDIHNNTITDFVQVALTEKFVRQTAFSPYGLISPRERYEIIQKYDASNKEIAQIFFGPEKENLFSEPWPDPNEQWNPPDALSLYSAVQIFMELFLYQQNKITALEATARALKRSINQSKSDLQSKINDLGFLQDSTCNKYSFSLIKLSHLAHQINSLNQITSVNANDTHFEFISIGNDPYMVLKYSLFPWNVRALKIEITAEMDTELQVFYKTMFFKGFHEANSVRKLIYAGRNSVVIELPKRRFSKGLRIDPGNSVGKFIIHKIEFGRC